MSTFELIQPHHRNRKAVIYIRQSSPHQVLTNLESRRMQHAMREHAQRLGWEDSRIETVEADTGIPATSTAGREAYKRLLAEVAAGEVGLVLSYESARLSRNCTDWYPLLDLCAYKDCLIADCDGIYDPASPNGRLLLGMKGILSEVELHTLRGRLLAGVQNKAKRGELALALPVGLVRQEDGRVVKDPDLQVQQAIDLVFQTFLAVKSAYKVLRHLREQGLRLPRRHRNAETIWREPTIDAVLGILQNPAYAGAFTYGKRRTAHGSVDGHPCTRQKRGDIREWGVIVHDRYPSYISWEIFEKIHSTLRNNYAEYGRRKSRGIPREGPALLQGLVYCGECGHKMTIQYRGGTRYVCCTVRRQTNAPLCQHIPATAVDQHVTAAFFEALSPIEVDLYEQAMQSRHAQREEDRKAQERELQRLRYEAQLARRQYDRVDPDNRLVASELERRWETALHVLQETEAKFRSVREEQNKVIPLTVPRELREAFSSLGQTLPEQWHKGSLTRSQQKALLQCLIEKVVLHRKEREQVDTRIVWRGGAVSEADVKIPVKSLNSLSDFKTMETRILELEAEGKLDNEIASLLTQQGFRSPTRTTLLPSTVTSIRLRHRRIHRFNAPRSRRVSGFLTAPQVAQALGVTPHWLYHMIRTGRIQMQRDADTGLYLFPDNASTLQQLRLLQNNTARRVSPRKGDQDA